MSAGVRAGRSAPMTWSRRLDELTRLRSRPTSIAMCNGWWQTVTNRLDRWRLAMPTWYWRVSTVAACVALDTNRDLSLSAFMPLQSAQLCSYWLLLVLRMRTEFRNFLSIFDAENDNKYGIFFRFQKDDVTFVCMSFSAPAVFAHVKNWVICVCHILNKCWQVL